MSRTFDQVLFIFVYLAEIFLAKAKLHKKRKITDKNYQ